MPSQNLANSGLSVKSTFHKIYCRPRFVRRKSTEGKVVFDDGEVAPPCGQQLHKAFKKDIRLEFLRKFKVLRKETAFPLRRATERR